MAFPSLEDALQQGLEPLPARTLLGRASPADQPGRRRAVDSTPQEADQRGAAGDRVSAKVEYRVKEEGETTKA